ncbi:hypothetical protein D777_01291 [Marinobacter nitratireducens]|uniref:Uncharacterized protein n=1 Tax=Marinobacter nitratireducens TaxID=1137280 RepID=A0A072N5Z3_9GAMM|nr:hypothetical protein D777_01291 [Marinobacter nitratireducens]
MWNNRVSHAIYDQGNNVPHDTGGGCLIHDQIRWITIGGHVKSKLLVVTGFGTGNAGAQQYQECCNGRKQSGSGREEVFHLRTRLMLDGSLPGYLLARIYCILARSRREFKYLANQCVSECYRQGARLRPPDDEL